MSIWVIEENGAPLRTKVGYDTSQRGKTWMYDSEGKAMTQLTRIKGRRDRMGYRTQQLTVLAVVEYRRVEL